MKEKISSFFSFISDVVWELFPNSPLAYIVYLFAITVICIFLIFYFAKKSKKNTQSPLNKEITLMDLLKIANNSKSSTTDLLVALQLFNEKFVILQDKKKAWIF